MSDECGHCWVYVWEGGRQVLKCINCDETR